MQEVLKIQCITPPTITPFLLQEAKDHLRVTNNDDDHYIQQLILAMNEIGTHFTNRALFTSTWRYYLDRFSRTGEILLPRSPVQSVTSIKYFDSAGASTTIDTDDFQLDKISEPARLYPGPDTYWPVIQFGRMNCVEIEFVAGYATRGQLPAALRYAMLQHISHLYDRREPVLVNLAISTVPFSILQNYELERVHRFF